MIVDGLRGQDLDKEIAFVNSLANPEDMTQEELQNTVGLVQEHIGI